MRGDPYRSETVLHCTWPEGCERTYTYLGWPPREVHSIAQLERDRVLALQAALEYGWTGDTGSRDRTERCPQHPIGRERAGGGGDG